MCLKMFLYELCTSEMSVLKMNYFFTENDTASSLSGDKINFWREKVIALLVLRETSRQLSKCRSSGHISQL